MKKSALLSLLMVIPFLSGCKQIGRYKSYDNADQYLVGSQTYEAYDQHLLVLDIDWKAGSINLVENTEINTITIEEKEGLKDDIKVRSLYSGGVLSIKYMKSNHVALIDSEDKCLNIQYNPEYLRTAEIHIGSGRLTGGTLTSLEAKLEIGSGSININEIHVTSIEANISSGEFYSKAFLSENTKIECSSGRIEIDRVSSFSSEFTVSSGKVSINELAGDLLKVTCSSGTIAISKINVNRLIANASSGKIFLSLIRFENGNAKASSGTIEITLPTDGGIVYTDVGSGSVNSERSPKEIKGSTYYYGESTSEFVVNVSSGKIIIK